MPQKRGASRNPPGVLCFSLDPKNASIHKRKRYETKRRKEVAEVRETGACLRCQLMKIPCSGGRPCVTCAQALFSAKASSYLWLLSCVPTLLAGLKGFFEADTPVDNAEVDAILGRNNHLMLSLVVLEFNDVVEWDITALSMDWALWMSQNDRVPTMSKVGIMSSLRFQNLLSPWIPAQLCSYFRLMMHTSSIVYNQGPKKVICGMPFSTFGALRSRAGTKVLLGLEDLLRPTELAKASLEKLSAIFLILFGTILAVLYNEPLEDDMVDLLSTRPHVQRVSAEEFSNLQDQLVRVLAYRLIDLAERLALLAADVSKQSLVDSAKEQWHLPATFAWEDSPIQHEPVGSEDCSPACDLDMLCGGQLKELLKSYDFYPFDYSSGLKEQYNCAAVSPTIPFITGQDNFTNENRAATSQILPTCEKCGTALPGGLPDLECYFCMYLDWGSWEASGADDGLVDSSSQFNLLTPLETTNNVYPPATIRNKLGKSVCARTVVSNVSIDNISQFSGQDTTYKPHQVYRCIPYPNSYTRTSRPNEMIDDAPFVIVSPDTPSELSQATEGLNRRNRRPFDMAAQKTSCFHSEMGHGRDGLYSTVTACSIAIKTSHRESHVEKELCHPTCLVPCQAQNSPKAKCSPKYIYPVNWPPPSLNRTKRSIFRAFLV